VPNIEDQDKAEDQHFHQMALNHLTGKCMPLEVKWADPIVVEYEGYESNPLLKAFEREATLPDDESLAERLDHKHKTYDHDSADYWDKILAYLTNLKLPEDCKHHAQIANCARPFFLFENMLWWRNRDKPPLQVILSMEIQMRICKEAHDDLGH
jgi:hypothetical protein